MLLQRSPSGVLSHEQTCHLWQMVVLEIQNLSVVP